MGMYISLHIEFRRGNNWHLLELDSPLFNNRPDERGLDDIRAYGCPLSFFEPFLNESRTHIRGGKELLSPELIDKIGDEDMLGYGVFMFVELLEYCQQLKAKFLDRVSQTGMFSLKKQLNRIENALLEGGVCRKPEYQEELESFEQLYDEFMHENEVFFSLANIVQVLVDVGNTDIIFSDIRLSYYID